MRGFSLPELLIAMLVSMVVIGAVFLVVQPAQTTFRTQLETADLQQRLRYAVATLTRDLMMAAEVFPYRRGAVGDDPAAGVFYRAGTLSARFTSPETGNPESHTYYLRPDASTGAAQLMQYDGGAGDFPLVDNVLQLAFELTGNPQPPTAIPPPAADADPDAADEYPAGENCLFVRSEGIAAPRLPVLGDGAGGVLLPAALLVDGPWCPNSGSPDRFDADLLRVRRVSVRLRMQVGQRSLRGPAGALFERGGTARSAFTYVPDREIRFDAAPRNVATPR